MPDTLSDRDWTTLLRRIQEKKCTPFIGAGASAASLPLGSEIASEWASEYGYPLSDADDLPRVGQYLAVDQDPLFPKEDIGRRWRAATPPDFSLPDSPHGILADLNLPLYLTTNYDDFMALALEHREKQPKRELCAWNRFVEMEEPSALADGFEPTPATPLVYHLHGHYSLPQSMVLTEDDYLDFLVNIANDQAMLPAAIRTALAGTSLLFVGYSLSDWNFRVLFRGLISSLGASLGMTSIAVQLSPHVADPAPEAMNTAQQYLERYFDTIQKIKVRTFWGDAHEFAAELRQRWEAFAGA